MAEAYEATRADPLAVLFEALQLDSRLRHHRRALLAPEKAEVVRSVAGELQRAVKDRGYFNGWGRVGSILYHEHCP